MLSSTTLQCIIVNPWVISQLLREIKVPHNSNIALLSIYSTINRVRKRAGNCYNLLMIDIFKFNVEIKITYISFTYTYF